MARVVARGMSASGSERRRRVDPEADEMKHVVIGKTKKEIAINGLG